MCLTTPPDSCLPAAQPDIPTTHPAPAHAVLVAHDHRELFLKQLTHVRLDRQRLAALPSEVLSRLPAASHVFLQHNRLASVAPLAALPGLKFLVLAHNRLAQVGRRRVAACLGRSLYV